jgi:predicted membrane chloride channel (bestrophin family)
VAFFSSLPCLFRYDNFFGSLLSLLVFKQIWFRVALVTCFSIAIVILDVKGVWVYDQVSIVAHTLIGLTLGVLLVFRTNSAYDRFWEGRKAWGVIMGVGRNLARMFAHLPPVHSTGESMRHLFVAFMVAIKCRCFIVLIDGRRSSGRQAIKVDMCISMW